MKSIARSFLLLGILVPLLTACVHIENPFTGLPPGPWRAILKIDFNPVTPNPKGEPLPEKVNYNFEEVASGELPFNFEVKYITPDSFIIEIINAKERIVIDHITIGRDLQTAKDTVLIEFPVFNSYIKGIFQESVIQGEWVDKNRKNYSIPFVAYHGKNHRFTHLRKTPAMDISGTWAVNFEVETGTPYPGIGIFKQEGNRVTGTFETETGDYRYLEGTIQGDRLYLSVFDGAHAFLFEAKINPDTTLIGSFRSGTHYRCLWEARKDPNAKLGDAFNLTFLKEDYDQIDFSFENTKGRPVSLQDDRYQDKVKIIQLLGTWCPNCRDETEFLVNYLKNNPHPDLEVIALAFEKQLGLGNKEEAVKALEVYRKTFGIDYEILLAGDNQKASAAKALPMVKEVLAFPTMLLVDRSNRVRKIHTGFSGPATSKYESFKKEFDSYLNALLSEQQ